MPRRSKTVPLASVSGPSPVAKLDRDRWKKIQDEYGKKNNIPAAVRQEIEDATNQFLQFAKLESVAEPVRDAIEEVQRIRQASTGLLGALIKDDQSDSVFAARREIERHLTVTAGGAVKLTDVMKVASAICDACADAQVALQEQSGGHVIGEAWAKWILNIGKILDRHSLPVAVRKDTDKSSDASPFVKLIRAIEHSFASQYRRGGTSEGACAALIIKARKRRRDRIVPEHTPE